MAYATLTDLTRLGIPSGALEGVSTEAKQAALDSASSLADGYLAAQFRLPLVEWGDDLTGHVCNLAAWQILKVRGFDPEGRADNAVRMGYEDAVSWLERVAAGRLSPQITDSTPEVNDQAPVFVNNPPRGW